MRITWRAKHERERRASRDDCPVCRGVEPISPRIRPLHLATIEVDHRRVEF